MKMLLFELYKLLSKPVFVLLTIVISAVLLVRFDAACRERAFMDRTLYEKTRDEMAKLPYDEANQKLSRDRDGLALITFQEIYGDSEEGQEILRMQFSEMAGQYGMRLEDFIAEYEQYAETPEEREKLQPVISTLTEQYQYVGNYRTFIGELPARAEELKSISIFAKKNSFSYRSIEKSLEDYEKLGTPVITPDLEEGVKALGSDYISIIFLMAIALGAAVILYSEEQDTKMLQLLRASREGHAPLAVSKLLALWTYSVLTVFLVTGGRIAIAEVRLGFGDLSRSLQSVSLFRDCVYQITVRQYLIFSILLPMAAVTVFSAVLSFLFIILEKPWMAAAGSAVLVSLEYLAYRFIPENFALNPLKFLNLFAFPDVEARFSLYANLNLFSYPVSALPAEILTGFLVFLLAMAGFIVAFSRDLRLRIRLPFSIRRRIRIRGSVRLFTQENYRLYIAFFGIAVLIVLSFLGYRRIEKGERLLSNAEYLYYSWGQEIAGEVTDETDTWIQKKQEELNREASGGIAADAELTEEARTAALFAAQMKSREIEEKQRVLLKIQEEVLQLQTARNRGIPVHYISAIQSDPVFMEGEVFLLQALLYLLILSVCVCPVFAEDEESGMGRLVHTTKHGRGRVFRLRYLGMLLLWTVSFLIFIVPELYNWIHVCRMSDWDAPVQSILRYTDCEGAMTIRQLMILWLCGSYISGIGYLSLMSLLSRVLQKKSTTIIVSVVVIAADFLVNLLSFPGFSLAALSSGYAVTEILPGLQKTGYLYIIFAKNLMMSAGILLLHRSVYVR